MSKVTDFISKRNNKPSEHMPLVNRIAALRQLNHNHNIQIGTWLSHDWNLKSKKKLSFKFRFGKFRVKKNSSPRFERKGRDLGTDLLGLYFFSSLAPLQKQTNHCMLHLRIEVQIGTDWNENPAGNKKEMEFSMTKFREHRIKEYRATGTRHIITCIMKSTINIHIIHRY
jgi:hypothetical protein